MRFILNLALAFACSAQRPDPGPSPRPDPAREAALAEILPVTTGEREDDHPAVASHQGAVWIAWVSYSETEGASHIFVRSFQDGKWTDATRVTETPGDYHKPSVAVDSASAVWVVWPAQVRGNWDLFGRRRAASGAWSPVERYTTDPAPDLSPQLASTGVRVMLVWQSLRRDNLDLYWKLNDRGNWSRETLLSDSFANDWEPALAATPDGAFHIAWDSFRGDYDVFLRSWRNGAWGPEIPIAASSKLENRASLTADSQNRVWIAWEVGPENWASDSANGGLRARRDIALACLANGKLFRVTPPDTPERGAQAPVLFAVSDGTLRLFWRAPININWLTVFAASWQGSSWTQPEPLLYSEGRVDQRVVAADAGANRILTVYPAGSSHNIVYAKIYKPASASSLPLATLESAAAKSSPPRAPRHTFQNHTLVWGDLHRHTDISEDGGIIDGSLIDAMRYSFDAAPLDFLGVTDHTRYLPRRYNLYRIQQISDLYYKPAAFVPLHAYERSQYTPWGHRNVVYMDRGLNPVPASYDLGDPGVSPWGLFNALRGRRAMSIPHTSAWGNKQVSWDYFDPQVERLVEMYQGLRSTYEYDGAPDPAGRAIYEKDSKNFVWDALARGRKLGFIASSDHRSTHMSFAAVYTKTIDRDGIFEGLNARRTYAATDKILLEFSIGNALMGEEVAITGVPEIKVAVTGVNDIARVDIIKNGSFAYTSEPKTRQARFVFRDQQFDGKESYYYVRVIQSDKQMAWSSPIWIRR